MIVSSSEGGEDWSASERWEFIGEEKERYLISTEEELYELLRRKKTFDGKVKEKSSEKLFELIKSLLLFSRENVRGLKLEMEEDDVGPNEQTRLGELTVLISFQQRSIEWMFNELRRRFFREKETSAVNERKYLSLSRRRTGHSGRVWRRLSGSEVSS